MEKFVQRETVVSNRKDNNRFRVYNLKTGAFYPEAEEFFLSSAGDKLRSRSA